MSSLRMIFLVRNKVVPLTSFKYFFSERLRALNHCPSNDLLECRVIITSYNKVLPRWLYNYWMHTESVGRFISCCCVLVVYNYCGHWNVLTWLCIVCHNRTFVHKCTLIYDLQTLNCTSLWLYWVLKRMIISYGFLY